MVVTAGATELTPLDVTPEIAATVAEVMSAAVRVDTQPLGRLAMAVANPVLNLAAVNAFKASLVMVVVKNVDPKVTAEPARREAETVAVMTVPVDNLAVTTAFAGQVFTKFVVMLVTGSVMFEVVQATEELMPVQAPEA